MIRGFQKVSEEQWNKDYTEKEIGDNWEVITNSILYEDLKLPKRMTAKSAGYDIFSPVSFILQPNQTIKIPTGIKTYMLEDEKLVVHPRGGQGFKFFVRLANTTGIIDSDYYNNAKNEGHIWVKLRNEGDKPFSVSAGEAFAQCIFEKYLLADGDEFSGNERKGGLGHTG